MFKLIFLYISVSRASRRKYSAVGSGTGWRRRIGCLTLIGQFPQKNLVINGSCAEGDLQIQASYAFSPFCNVSIAVSI